jgi:hypothetical protein
MPKIQSSNLATETLLPSAARTASGVSAMFTTHRTVKALVIEVDVTAVAGTSPTLAVALEDTFDGSDWNKVADVATSITAAGRTVLRLNAQATPLTDRHQLSFTIGGSGPSFTFSVTAHYVQE